MVCTRLSGCSRLTRLQEGQQHEALMRGFSPVLTSAPLPILHGTTVSALLTLLSCYEGYLSLQLRAGVTAICSCNENKVYAESLGVPKGECSLYSWKWCTFLSCLGMKNSSCSCLRPPLSLRRNTQRSKEEKSTNVVASSPHFSVSYLLASLF